MSFCTWFKSLFKSPKPREPETFPVPTPTPPVTPVPPQAQETLSIFYGWPSTKTGQWGSTIVLADEMRFPNHPEYLRGMKLCVDHKVFGYIPLGTEDNPTCLVSIDDHGNPKASVKRLSQHQFEDAVAQWRDQGAAGIMVDTFGHDYGNDTSEQLNALYSIHSAGLRALVNAWNPEDVPWEQIKTPVDFLFESPQEDLDVTERRMAYWKSVRPEGARAYAVTTAPMSASDKARLEFMAAKYGVSCIEFRNDGHFTHD